MFFNKSLIKREKFVSCLMQHSKKYWKWPETYKLILHSYWTPQFQNFAIPPTWLSSHSITQRYCHPCITFSLHNFKHLPIWQLEFLTLVIPLFFGGFFWRFLRNYVSIVVNIISNNTVLQFYLLWIFVSIRFLQLIVCIGVSTPSRHPKNITPFFSFLPSLLINLQTIQAPPFQAIHPLQKMVFSCPTPPPAQKKKSDFSVNSHNIKIFHD